MSHLPVSLMNRLNQTESAIFKLWMMYFQRIPFRLFDSEVLSTTGKALITFCVDFFLIKCFDRQLYFSAKKISLGFYFSHAKTLFYIFDINKSTRIFQQILKMFAAYFDRDKIFY